MKNNVNLIVVLFFWGISCFAGLGQTLTKQDYSKLARLFAKDVQLKTGSREAYANYQSTRSQAPFSHSRVLALDGSLNKNIGIDKILIIVNSSMYNQLTDKINRYAHDINNVYKCEIIMEIFTGGDHADVKDLIVSNQNNLSGVVFIGNIPAAWFEISDDFNEYGYASWPCDLYYMDLNGEWIDTDGNGIYDSHIGDVEPEIFVGRISTANMGRLLSEKVGLERYLDKNHKFWIGETPVNKKFGLSYTDHDWLPNYDIKTDIQYLYGELNYDTIAYGDPFFGKADYLDRLSNNRYEFIQLACHAGHDYLAMSEGGIPSSEIFNNGTEAIGYNLFCCSAADWTAVFRLSIQGFLAGSHVYNANNSSLVAVGSTKTGSMLNFDKFYIPLGEGKSIGESLKLWWITAYGTMREEWVISWHYGMSIIGDPMVNFYHSIDNAQGLASYFSEKNKVYFDATKQVIVIDKVIQNQSLTLELMDLQGKVILRKKDVDNTPINIENLPDGVYLYRLLQDGQVIYTGKILKRAKSLI